MKKRGEHIILLGGIGGDSHSVGLAILRQALLANGYAVRYLGTQNRLEAFFQYASMCNVVMISSMDGHMRYYVRDFPELMKQYRCYGPLWYLGGNLHIGDAVGYERNFLEMGFDRVFVKFVDIKTVLELLARDLAHTEPVTECPTLWDAPHSQSPYLAHAVSDDQLEQSDFERQRRDVLEGWKTGRAARDIEENAEFLSRQPSFPKAQAMVNAGRAPMLIQPRSGVALLEDQVKLFQTFKSVGVKVVSYQVDSLTRNNNYIGAEEAINESRLTGLSSLNGFPVINHGVAGLRRIAATVNLPIQTRHSTRDPRLLAEIAYGGGVTAFEGGPICYNIPYYKDYPVGESINTWRYVDRLTGIYYEKYGIGLDREFFGTLTATLIPPSLAIATGILESILAVRQGVKCVSPGYAEQGNRIQDIAAIRVMKSMTEAVIQNLGYKDVQVNTIFHQYMAAFPDDLRAAESLIFNSAVTAALSGATRTIIKTVAEAYKIPTLEDNVHGIELVMRALASAGGEGVDEDRIAREGDIIRRETQAILDSVIMCGNGSVAEGVVTAFRKGYLDIPFSPSLHNRAAVVTVRDIEGAVRFASVGNMQFDRDLVEFHQQKVEERRRAEGIRSPRQDYILVEKDVLQIARQQYERWPLYGAARRLQAGH